MKILKDWFKKKKVVEEKQECRKEVSGGIFDYSTLLTVTRCNFPYQALKGYSNEGCTTLKVTLSKDLLKTVTDKETNTSSLNALASQFLLQAAVNRVVSKLPTELEEDEVLLLCQSQYDSGLSNGIYMYKDDESFWLEVSYKVINIFEEDELGRK